MMFPKPPQRIKTTRKRINPRSKKRIAETPQRQFDTATVIARDGRCMFFPLLCEYMQISERDLIRFAGMRRCDTGHPLVMHETGHSRNDGRTGPKGKLAMCWTHNGVLEDAVGEWRKNYEGAGLIRRANGDPIRKYRNLETQ